MMNTHRKLLALFALYPNTWRTISFSVPLPKALVSKDYNRQTTTNAQRVAKSELYGYNDGYFSSLRDASVPDDSWSALHSQSYGNTERSEPQPSA
eukprot:14142211-Ditylum_brightwellii.AAC.1